MKTAVFLSILFILSSTGFATTIYVPDDYLTIQGAIDAASVNGDKIIVRPGTYVENIDFLGKAIHLKSEKGPVVTVIDGGSPTNPDFGSVVTFTLEEGNGSILEGFTITKGTGTHLFYMSRYSGGGTYCEESSPTIVNNFITYNTCNWQGAGIYCYNSNARIENNKITFNTGSDDGGGVYCVLGGPEVISNTISNNESDDGGGLEFDDTEAQVDNNVVTHNIVNGNGAGGGGGVFVQNLVSSNIAHFTNNTICNNIVYNGPTGGGICIQFADPIIKNTIFWDNFADEGSEIYADPGSTPLVEYCCVKGGWTGTGNIDADPLFADPLNGDFHLTWDSPCRDSGDNSVVTEPTDFEGDPRIALGTVDMGADEYYYHLYHMGDVIPGSPIDVKVVGYPGAIVALALNDTIVDPPINTQHGDLYIVWPLLWNGKVGKIPGTGILSFPATVPSGWTSGDQYYLQALVGPWGGAWTRLTNFETLVGE